jgi:predicted amidohydrolase
MLIASTIQFAPKLSFSAAEVKENIKKAVPLIDAAGSQGSELIVLPELAFTGYCFTDPSEAFRVAERQDGYTYQVLKELAESYSAYIAYGFVEAIGDKLYNSCNVISPEGIIIDNYQKTNLWGCDFLWATSGNKAPRIIKTDFGTMSTVICRDIKASIPGNIPRLAAKNTPFFKKTPNVIAACTNWGKGGFPSNTWMDFAANNQCHLIISNRYGIEKNSGLEHDFGSGGSIIIEPSWKIHRNGLKFNQDCCVTASLSFDAQTEDEVI